MATAAGGSIIGAIFGFIFVFANSASLPTPVTAVLRILAACAGAWVLLLAVRRREGAVPPPSQRQGFGPRYWLIVAAEAAAIFGGLALLNGPLDAPEASVGWIAFVVGAHFLGLGAAWRLALFRWLGAALVLSGGTALVLAAAGAPDWAIDVVGGVLSGAILLAFSGWGVTHSDMPPAT